MKHLTLSGNTIGIEAAKAIGASLETHTEFQFAHWKDMFTGRMKTEIPPALKHLSSGILTAGAQLVELDLSDNAFGPIGMEGIVDLLKSRSCFTLKELKLNNTGCGVTGGKKLAETLLEGYNNSKKTGTPLALKVNSWLNFTAFLIYLCLFVNSYLGFCSGPIPSRERRSQGLGQGV